MPGYSVENGFEMASVPVSALFWYFVVYVRPLCGEVSSTSL